MIDLQSALAGKQGRVFVPLVYRLAARLEQLEWADFGDDPPTAAFALRATQRLLGLGALVSHYRLGAEAEACGVQLARDPLTGDWAVPPAPAAPAIIPGDPARRPPLDGLLDLTRRLASELQGEVAVIAVLTGPRTLGVLLGETAGLAELYAGLGRAYAESGARLLLVAEDPRLAAAPAASPGLLHPLLNVARYFRVPMLVQAEHRGRIPIAWLRDQPKAHALATEAGLLMTATEVPPDVPLEHLRAWCEALG